MNFYQRMLTMLAVLVFWGSMAQSNAITGFSVYLTNSPGQDCFEAQPGMPYPDFTGSWNGIICGVATFNYTGPAGVYRIQWRPGVNAPQEWMWLNYKFTNAVAGSNSITMLIPPFDPEFPAAVFRLAYNPYP